jgi:hypothetical protein
MSALPPDRVQSTGDHMLLKILSGDTTTVVKALGKHARVGPDGWLFHIENSRDGTRFN